MIVDGVNTGLPRTPEEFCAQPKSAWRKLLEEKVHWASIPLLNYTPQNLLRDNTLVRFRGMIQDMRDPELYATKYLVKSVGGAVVQRDSRYRDYPALSDGETVACDDAANCDCDERRTLLVVSTPGINEWTAAYEADCNKTNALHGANPPMEIEHADAQTPVLSESYLINAPIPERPGMACRVIVYEELEAHALNSLVDVIGYLSIDPRLAVRQWNVDDDEFSNNQEAEANHPPPSLIPRLHAIAIKPLAHANPLLDASLQSVSSGQCQQEELSGAELTAIRYELLQLLETSTFNDGLAAKYLLANLISSVHTRMQCQAVGKFALNICNLPTTPPSKDYAKTLYELLALLLPTSHYLPMDLDNMNTIDFVPKKDYQTNKLISGQLQLGAHTHLVLDETRMEAGNLQRNGIEGIQHLAHLINNQELKCDFKFYQIEYHVNIPILIISEGRSLLPADFVLPLQVATDSAESCISRLKLSLKALLPEQLDRFRRYLTQARLGELTLDEGATEFIQHDFVNMRKAKELNSGDELNSMIVLSRLLALSQGKTNLDKETWQIAKEYELKRLRRVKCLETRAN